MPCLGCFASCCATMTCGLCTSVASGVSKKSARLAYCGLFGLSLIVSWILREVGAPLLEKLPCESHSSFSFYFLLLISLSLRQFDSLSPDCLWILVISLEENLYLGMMSITCWCNKFLTILIVRTCWRCIGFVRLSLLRWVADWVTFKTFLFFIFCFN